MCVRFGLWQRRGWERVEGNGGSGLGGVDGGVDGASVDPNGVDIGSDT